MRSDKKPTVTWIDAFVGFLVVWFGLDIIHRAIPWKWLQGSYAWPVAGHLWDAAVPLFFYGVLGRRFPIGKLQYSELRGWFSPFAITLGLGLLASLVLRLVSGASARDSFDYSASGWIFQATMPGFGEEFLFRGLIQTGLNQSIRIAFVTRGVQVRLGTILASLLFGVTHLGNPGGQPLAFTAVQVTFAPVIGLMIGIGYDRTRNIWGAMFAHNASNLLDQAVIWLLA